MTVVKSSSDRISGRSPGGRNSVSIEWMSGDGGGGRSGAAEECPREASSVRSLGLSARSIRSVGYSVSTMRSVGCSVSSVRSDSCSGSRSKPLPGELRAGEVTIVFASVRASCTHSGKAEEVVAGRYDGNADGWEEAIGLPKMGVPRRGVVGARIKLR